jgi:hypothetical protein
MLPTFWQRIKIFMTDFQAVRKDILKRGIYVNFVLDILK